MNTGKLALLALLALSLPACKKEKEEAQDQGGGTAPANVNVRFNFMHGLNAFDINGIYADGMGHAIQFTTLKDLQRLVEAIRSGRRDVYRVGILILVFGRERVQFRIILVIVEIVV